MEHPEQRDPIVGGRKVAALRNQLGLTQEEFGQAVGLTKGGVARIEGSAATGVKLSKLKRIAAVAKMDLPALRDHLRATETDVRSYQANKTNGVKLTRPAKLAAIRRMVEASGLSVAEVVEDLTNRGPKVDIPLIDERGDEVRDGTRGRSRGPGRKTTRARKP